MEVQPVFRGFYGACEARVTAGERTVTSQVRLSSGMPNELTITLQK